MFTRRRTGSLWLFLRPAVLCLEERLTPAAIQPASVDYLVSNNWGTGLQASIRIALPADTGAGNWQLTFDYAGTIQSLWDARIVSSGNGRYVVEGFAWNKDLPQGGSVSFGFIATGATGVSPAHYVLTGTPTGGGSTGGGSTGGGSTGGDSTGGGSTGSGSTPANDSLTATYAVSSFWMGGFVGGFTIRNTGSTASTTWTLSFDSTNPITNLWGGRIVSQVGTRYVVEAETWTGRIRPGGSAQIGFTAIGNWQVSPTHITLNGTSASEPPLPPPPPPPPPPLPTLNVSPASTLESSGVMTFTVTLSSASSTPVNVQYQTKAGTATAGVDYQAVNGTLSFAPGQTSQTIQVPIIDDALVEGNETLTLLLSGAVGATLGTTTVIGTILDDDSAPPPPPPPPGGASDYRVVAYFPEWAIYGRQFEIADVPAAHLTHLIYAFAQITPEGTIGLFDSWAAVEKPFGNDTWDQPLRGNFNQIRLLKERYPHLQVLIAVGGWTLSGPFSDVAASSAAREKFSASVVAFCKQYGFDGVDLDWEYPGGGGLGSNRVRPEDGDNYVLLLRDLRAAFDAQSAIDGKTYLITAATAAGADKLPNHRLAAMSTYLDWFNVMTYDYHGTWELTTNHQAALYGPGTNNVHWTIQAYLDAGVPANEIVMGVPLYARAWSGTSGLGRPATGAAPGTWEPGMYDYKQMLELIRTQPNVYLLHWDEAAGVPYVTAPTIQGGLFSTFENTQSLQRKLNYVQQYGLGGVMFWEISGDVSHPNSPDSLVGLAAEVLLGVAV